MIGITSLSVYYKINNNSNSFVKENLIIIFIIKSIINSIILVLILFIFFKFFPHFIWFYPQKIFIRFIPFTPPFPFIFTWVISFTRSSCLLDFHSLQKLSNSKDASIVFYFFSSGILMIQYSLQPHHSLEILFWCWHALTCFFIFTILLNSNFQQSPHDYLKIHYESHPSFWFYWVGFIIPIFLY